MLGSRINILFTTAFVGLPRCHHQPPASCGDVLIHRSLQVTYQHMQLESWDAYVGVQDEVQAFNTKFKRLSSMGCSELLGRAANNFCVPLRTLCSAGGMSSIPAKLLSKFPSKLLGVAGSFCTASSVYTES